MITYLLGVYSEVVSHTLNLDPLFLYTPRSFDSLENGPFFQACTRLFRLSRPALEQLSPMSRGLDELRRFTRPV